mgnify:CR=1 FL=1
MNAKRKGIEWERQIMKKLSKLGYYVTRSRASFGFFDIWAFHPYTGVLLLIQAKSTSKDYVRLDSNLKKANELAQKLKERGFNHIKIQLWIKFRNRRKVKIIDLPIEKNKITFD